MVKKNYVNPPPTIDMELNFFFQRGGEGEKRSRFEERNGGGRKAAQRDS